MIPYAKEFGALVLLALLTFGGWKLYAFGYENGHNAASVKAEQTIAAFAKAEAEAQAKARATEQARVESQAEIAAHREARQREIETAVENRTAELVAGTKRLRHEIAAYATERLSRDSTAPAELSEAAERGATLVGEAVGIGAECDATQRALIDAYEAVRQ